ncbi:carboxymuconolactone decarboxylase family protein [Sphingomonas populi]|uniref:Carboxymuconolactone decarboxylase family protein n=1 Tax=Sphingomonas populi TaxID=2484750 RepID=A0A4Q6Y1S3_9SPHN|nr:carboxymuconolactone decarboxylase family protein [Sphingomonas populi]RZF63239.1 carboxymuconolactone decarboxylase family protein [Sphingomonas populi]
MGNRKIWLARADAQRQLGPDFPVAWLAALIALRAMDELPAHLRRGVDNGIDKRAFSELITHLAFYAGFPAAISASVCAAQTLGPLADD